MDKITGVPVKHFNDNDVVVGSDVRNSVVFADLDKIESDYIDYLTDSFYVKPKDVENIDPQSKERIDSHLAVFKDYPYFGDELLKLSSYFVEITELSDFTKIAVKLLLEMGIHGFYAANDTLRGTLIAYVESLGYDSFTVRKDRPHNLVALLTHFNSFDPVISEHYNTLHIPYLSVLLQGTSALVTPISNLGITPCGACYSHIFAPEIGGDSQFKAAGNLLRQTLAYTLAGIVASSIANYALGGVMQSKVVSLRDPGMQISYIDAEFSMKCICHKLSEIK